MYFGVSIHDAAQTNAGKSSVIARRVLFQKNKGSPFAYNNTLGRKADIKINHLKTKSRFNVRQTTVEYRVQSQEPIHKQNLDEAVKL